MATAPKTPVSERKPSIPFSAGLSSRYDELANTPFQSGYPTKESIAAFKEELLFQRGVQSYLWAVPALNMYAMKEGSVILASIAAGLSKASARNA